MSNSPIFIPYGLVFIVLQAWSFLTKVSNYTTENDVVTIIATSR